MEDESRGSRIRRVKIIKRQKEQTFPLAVSMKVVGTFPVYSRAILWLPSALPVHSSRTAVLEGTPWKRESLGNTSAVGCACVRLLNHSPYKLTFIWTKYQQVLTRVSSMVYIVQLEPFPPCSLYPRHSSDRAGYRLFCRDQKSKAVLRLPSRPFQIGIPWQLTAADRFRPASNNALFLNTLPPRKNNGERDYKRSFCSLSVDRASHDSGTSGIFRSIGDGREW